MKKAFLLIFGFYIFLGVFCQETDDDFQTIFGGGKTRISGFGGPFMSFTQIGDDFAHMMGGGGGVIIGDFFAGGYGMGKTNRIDYRYSVDSVLNFGHGGFWLGYTFMSNRAIHPVVHTQIGWGSISKRPKNMSEYEWDDNSKNSDPVFVVTPTAELEFNFSRFFKLGAGVTFPMVFNVPYPYSESDFAKPGVFLSFKFGWF